MNNATELWTLLNIEFYFASDFLLLCNGIVSLAYILQVGELCSNRY